MYIPWFPDNETDSDFVTYIHGQLHHVRGEEVEYPDSSWSYMDDSPSPFEEADRSDKTLHFKILEAFYHSDRLDSSKINVLVYNGKVNLSGSVFSENEKKTAEEIVKAIPFVWTVENELLIELPH